MTRRPRARKVLFELLETRRLLASGELDPSFGSAGKVIAVQGFIAHDTTLQANGKVLVVGEKLNPTGTNFDFALGRFNEDGAPDSSFGDGGLVTGDFEPERNTGGIAVAVQSDGKIVIVGSHFRTLGLARFNADGTFDTTFSADGKATLELVGDRAVDLAVQPNGKIVVATGRSVYRFNANGTLDASFSDDGIAPLKNATQSEGGRRIALQPDGKILVAGGPQIQNRERMAMWRLNTDGSTDTTFDDDGLVVTPRFHGHANAVAVQDDGKIILAGGRTSFNAGRDVFLARFLPNGELDTSFLFEGISVRDFGGLEDEAVDVVLQDDDKIVVLARVNGNSEGSDVGLLRLNADGSLDGSFNNDGKVVFAFQTIEEPHDVALRNGKILIGGRTQTSNFVSSIALARLDGSARPDNLFLSSTAAPENLPAGGVVGTLTTLDDDPGDTFTYSLAAGAGATNNGGFEIVGNQVRTRHRLNDEIKSSYSIRVRSTDSFGNFRDRAFTITVVDGAPALGGISGSIGYTQGAPAIVISSTATVSDADSQNFAGGKLTVEITSGVDASNRLLLGWGFTLDGNQVVHDGQTIGTLNSGGGVGTTKLEVAFNVNATRGIVQQLLRTLRFRTNAGTSTEPRAISFTLLDGDGGVSNTPVKTVNVANP